MKRLARLLRQSALPGAGLLLVSGLVLSLAGPGSAELPFKDLVSIPRRGMELMKIDRNTGGTLLLSSLPINLPDSAACNFQGGNGMAVNPLTEALLALLNCGGQDGPRLLAVIGTFNGNATIIGDTGHSFAGLAFAGDGTLFAVTGTRGVNPNTLFIMNTTNAMATPVCQLPQHPPAEGGQTIAFNPDDGLLYHASGNSQEQTKLFASIDDVTPTDPLAPCPLTPRGPTGADYLEATALVYSGSSFFLADLGDKSEGRFYSITSAGAATLIGRMDHVSRGLAFINGPGEVCYEVNRDGVRESNDSMAVEDSIAGPRAVLLKLKEAFTLCVPAALRFTLLSTVTPGAGAAAQEDDSIVTGRLCYRVKKDDSRAAKKTDLEVEDEGKGQRTVQIKTREAFVVCEKALIDTNGLP